MAFNPSEPRDPHGKWTLEGIMKDIGALPQGGQGNRTSFKGIEVRRHQSGAYRVKINGEARHYGTHEEAAKAVHGRSHTSAGARQDAVREAVTSGSVSRPAKFSSATMTATISDVGHGPELHKGDVVTYVSHRGGVRGRQGQVHHVRITRDEVHKSSTGGRNYVGFTGVRVRPNDHNVSFGNEGLHTARASDVRVVRRAPESSASRESAARSILGVRGGMSPATARTLLGGTGYKPPRQGAGRQNTRSMARNYLQGEISGAEVTKGGSGNYGVAVKGKRIGIVIPEKDGSFTFEHKRGDHQAGYQSLEQAVSALVERDRRGESIGGRGESLRQIGGITSSADERAKVKREIASIEEQIREMGEPASGYTPAELAETRSADIRSQLAQGEKRIWVKVPGGSEVSMSPETARELLKQRKSPVASAPYTPAYSGMARSYAASAQASSLKGETQRMAAEKDRLVTQMQGVAADYAREPDGPKKQRLYMKMVDLSRRINTLGGK